MSGGRFDYVDSRCKSEIFGWDDKCRNVFEDREISELIFDVFDLIHDYDWYASGDTCEETYLKAKAEFKNKWLKHDNERVKRIIDNAISEARGELYKTYGVPRTERIKTLDYCDICNHKRCENCIANNLDDYCVPSGYEPKDEPQTDNLFTDKDGDVWEWRGNAWYCISGDEPQMERSE